MFNHFKCRKSTEENILSNSGFISQNVSSFVSSIFTPKNKKIQSIQNKKVGTLLKPNIIEIQFANMYLKIKIQDVTKIMIQFLVSGYFKHKIKLKRYKLWFYQTTLLVPSFKYYCKQ